MACGSGAIGCVAPLLGQPVLEAYSGCVVHEGARVSLHGEAAGSVVCVEGSGRWSSIGAHGTGCVVVVE